MTDQLDLRKKVELVLAKGGFSSNIKAKVCLILDESGSMRSEFNNGTVSNIVDRALAVGYKFDDDGSIDVWSFSDSFQRRPEATQDDHGKYLQHTMMGGSTIYHGVLGAVADDYFVEKSTGGFLGFGGKKEVVSRDGHPAFIIFITDGEPDSRGTAVDKVGRILKTYPDMFVQFIGIGQSHFPTLETIASQNENCSLAVIGHDDSDEVILEKFLNVKARRVLEK